jgi:hypothetical protein
MVPSACLRFICVIAAETRFDRLFSGIAVVAVERPSWITEG